MEAYALEAATTAFDESRERLETILAWLSGPESAGLTHAELEARLQVASRELFCQLVQDHLDLRAEREPRLADVVDADQVPRDTVEARRARTLATVFGDVRVERLAYRARGHADLHPADGVLNLPAEQHSHGLRRLAAVEAARGSFAEAAWSVAQATGQRLGNRQVEQLSQRAAVDFDQFYATRSQSRCEAGDVLVLSCDGKGVVMRPQALRPATARPPPAASCSPACPKESSATASGSPRSAASTTAPRSPEPPARSCPHPTSPTHPAAPDHGRGANGWSPASPWTPPG